MIAKYESSAMKLKAHDWLIHHCGIELFRGFFYVHNPAVCRSTSANTAYHTDSLRVASKNPHHNHLSLLHR